MALDVYVMPLWRFKAGEFTSPVEQVTGIKPTIISLSHLSPPPAPWYLRLLVAIGVIELVENPEPTNDPVAERTRAVQEVEILKTRLLHLVGKTVDWEDEGCVYYSEQFHASGLVKGLAAWHDHLDTMPEFLPAPPGRDSDYYPVWDLPEPVQRRFPTLVKHSLHTGYFLPVVFEGVYEVEPFKAFGHWDMHHDVASSQAILHEVDELLASVVELQTAGGSSQQVSYLEAGQTWLEILQEICRLSVEHGVPVIFYG